MAWPHLKAATESDLYDGRGSFKNIMYRICSLVRKDGQQHAGWCTASENYIAETTGFSLRQVQRAVAQFKKDGVFAIRTYRRGGKEFNHYRPNDTLFNSRKRNPQEPVLVCETVPDDRAADSEEGTRQAGVWPHDTVSSSTRPVGGVVCITSEVKEDEVNARGAICRTELRSDSKSSPGAVSSKALTGKDHGGSAPEPPLCSVQRTCEDLSSSSEFQSESSPESVSPLGAAAEAARSKEDMLAVLAKREPVPPPPSREDLDPPPTAAAPRPTTPFQIAKALVEDTKRSAWDTYLRAYSLAFQFAGYLEERAAKGEKAYAFSQWEVMYTADFVDALNRGWKFKDVEDAIDIAQTTKFRFVCCTPRRLFDNAESVMKLVHVMRRKGMTPRQKLGDSYPSWYLINAGSLQVDEMKLAVGSEITEEERQRESECQRLRELGEDIPVLTLTTTGRIKCITPECPYRFDTREQMVRHFDECFQRLCESTPTDPEEALEEEMEDAYDDKYGVIPCSAYPWYEDDEKAGRLEQYAPKNADLGTMFAPWVEGNGEPPQD